LIARDLTNKQKRKKKERKKKEKKKYKEGAINQFVYPNSFNSSVMDYI